MTESRVDVAVVGAGPAGIAAAAAAAERGARVLLVDQGASPGGQIWRHRAGAPAPAAARRWLDRLRSSGATAWSLSTVVDATGAALLIDRPDGAREVAARRLVIATGARELFLPFPGWTLPGVLGVAALQALVESGADCAGRRIVLSGSGPLLLAVARRLTAHGAAVQLVAEQASTAAWRRFGLGLWRRPGTALRGLRLRLAAGHRLRLGCWVSAAFGDGQLRSVELCGPGRRWRIDCDLLGASVGLVPNTELARLLGCRVERGRVVVDEQQRTSVDGVCCAGEPTGIGGAELALVEGEIAGRAAAGAEAPRPLTARRQRLRRFADALEVAFAPRPELAERLGPDTVVCRCEDVAWSAVEPGWSGRQAKLVCRIGMGPCQGRICGPAMGFLCGWEEGVVRPPIEPAALRTLVRGEEGPLSP